MAKKKKVKKTKIEPKDRFTVSFSLCESDLKTYYLTAYRPTIIAWSVLFALAVVLAIFAYTRILGIACAAIVLIYCIVQFMRVRKIYRTDLERPHIFADCELTLDGTSWVMKTKKTENAPIEWMDMHEVRSLKTLYVFCITSQSRALVPKNAFTEEQLAWMEQEVVPTVKNAPKLRAQQNKKKRK